MDGSERGRPGPVTAGGRSARSRTYVLVAAFAVASTVAPIAFLSYGTVFGDGLAPAMGLAALALPVGWYAGGLARFPRLGWAVAVPAAGLAIVSVVTGFHNGLTDEPYAMPAFLGPLLHGHNPYADPVSVTYNQYGTVYTIRPAYVYLPVLIFLQPFVVSYKWFAVAAWLTTLYLLRARSVALVAVGQGTVGLVAASGFNDPVVLLLLTLGLVGIGGRRQWWAEILSLGAKQFANVFLVAYYAIRRDLRRVAITVGVSVAFVLPFVVWNPHAFYCQAIYLWPPGCAGVTSGPSVATHVNYWIWPVWALGVFFEPLRTFVTRRRNRTPPDGDGEESADAVVSPSVTAAPRSTDD